MGGAEGGVVSAVLIHQIEVVALVGAAHLMLPVEHTGAAEDIVGDAVAVEDKAVLNAFQLHRSGQGVVASVVPPGGTVDAIAHPIVIHRVGIRTGQAAVDIAEAVQSDAVPAGHVSHALGRVGGLGGLLVGIHISRETIGCAGQEVAAADAAAGMGKPVHILFRNIGGSHGGGGVAAVDGAHISACEAAHPDGTAGVPGHIHRAHGAGAGDHAGAAVHAREGADKAVGSVGLHRDLRALEGAPGDLLIVEAHQSAGVQRGVIGGEIQVVACRRAVGDVAVVVSRQHTGVGIVVGLLGVLAVSHDPSVCHLGGQDDVAQSSRGTHIAKQSGVHIIGQDIDAGDCVAAAVIERVELLGIITDRLLAVGSRLKIGIRPAVRVVDIGAIVQVSLLLDGDIAGHGSAMPGEILAEQIELPGGTDAHPVLPHHFQSRLFGVFVLHLLHRCGEVGIEVVKRLAFVIIKCIRSDHLDGGVEVGGCGTRSIDDAAGQIPEVVVVLPASHHNGEALVGGFD